MADEPDLNDPVSLPSETQQIDETPETGREFLALARLELAHKGLFELTPVVGEAISDAHAPLGESHAGRQLGAYGLADDQAALDEPGEAGCQGRLRQAQLGGQFWFGGARAAELEQDGIIARLQALFEHGQQQRLVRKLSSFDEPVKSGAG